MRAEIFCPVEQDWIYKGFEEIRQDTGSKPQGQVRREKCFSNIPLSPRDTQTYRREYLTNGESIRGCSHSRRCSFGEERAEITSSGTCRLGAEYRMARDDRNRTKSTSGKYGYQKNASWSRQRSS